MPQHERKLRRQAAVFPINIMDRIIFASEIRIYYKKYRENCEVKTIVLVFTLFLKEMTYTKRVTIYYVE